ncbi:SWI/SNF complex subunit SWI3A isoform X2 [Ananas comosus]|uniref:SWI/SNF complex subunit SWI3A isoform X2 n=1 Tax=Ananas comosus TaxID=4615 RepID=A0A6P5GSL6_ANACO|nr:SWI/SNF complex subunit SWI3A isoform X2 [Ananas comosus]
MRPSGQEEEEEEEDEDDSLARDLYTIPISSGWFRWDGIHDTERRSLPEFFEGSSFTRNPRVYKDYRDFIINKYREDPSCRLTFTDVRKALVGDVSLLRKLFLFLERWGLINFGAGAAPPAAAAAADGVALPPGEAAGPSVVVEEGAPWGVRVVPPLPQSYAAERKSGGAGAATAASAVGGDEIGCRLPPLTSYSDVFGEWTPRKAPFCGFCGEECSAGQHELMEVMKGGFVVCAKCSKSKVICEEETVQLSDHKDGDVNGAASAWTDAETLLLLEAVLKHGDDWDLIAQHVRTKSKSDCIARLIQLPFGEHMLGSMNVTSTHTDGKENVVDESTEERPLKRRCFLSSLDATDSLMNQVALLSTVAGPHVAAAAADTAVTTLCNENTRARDALIVNEETMNNSFSSNGDQCSGLNVGDQDMMLPQRAECQMDKSFGAAAYRMRAATVTAMGAAAARAKLFAEHEEREMQLLMASIIEAQLRKIQYKLKHFEELEHTMEQEYTLIQQSKESILAEWVNLLRQAFRAGIARLRDHHVFPKPFLNKNCM